MKVLLTLIGLTAVAALTAAGPTPTTRPTTGPMAGPTTGPTRAQIAARVDPVITICGSTKSGVPQRGAAILEALPFEDLPYLRDKSKDKSVPAGVRATITAVVGRMQVRSDRWERNKAKLVVFEDSLCLGFEASARAEDGDGRWNADVIKGIELIKSGGRGPERFAEADRTLAGVIGNGCDSPTVRMLRVKALLSINRDQTLCDRLLVEAQQSPLRPKMTPIAAAHLDLMLLGVWSNGRGGGTSPNHIDVVLDTFDDFKKNAIEAAKDPSLDDLVKGELFLDVLKAAIPLKIPMKDTVDEIFPAFDAGATRCSTIHYARGSEYVEFAWDARGDGTGGKVTDTGWQTFGDRLKIAGTELSRAYELDPNDDRAPTQILKVELGQGRGRDEMEKWFNRAMKANPDNYPACAQKLLWLEPKWHGSVDEVLKFGHECADGGNWAGEIPITLIDAHLRASQYAENPADYFAQPQVWQDIHDVAREFMLRYPDNPRYPSIYVKYACKCRQWKEADSCFKKFPKGSFNPVIFGGQGELDALKKEAAEKAASPDDATP